MCMMQLSVFDTHTKNVYVFNSKITYMSITIYFMWNRSLFDFFLDTNVWLVFLEDQRSGQLKFSVRRIVSVSIRIIV